MFMYTILLLVAVSEALNTHVEQCLDDIESSYNHLLCNPQAPAMTQTAPEEFTVQFNIENQGYLVSSVSSFRVNVKRANAPHAADRFYNMVINQMFAGQRFYRVVAGWVAQFGVNGHPAVNAVYNYQHNVPGAIIPSDPVVLSNVRGTLSYSAAYDATTGRAVNMTSELFINFDDNSEVLDPLGFAAFGTIDSVDTVERRINNLYGEMPSICKEGADGTANPHWQDARCLGPNEKRVYSEGTDYLKQSFPLMTFIQSASIYGPDPNRGGGNSGGTSDGQGNDEKEGWVEFAIILGVVLTVVVGIVVAIVRNKKKRKVIVGNSEVDSTVIFDKL